MKHFFHKSGESQDTFILLHGSGGRETDLLHVAGKVDSSHSILGVRGSVIENGKFRYFERHKDGTLDLISLKERSEELLSFIEKAAKEYEFDLNRLHLIGYSNGANMATRLLVNEPDFFKSAMLFHPVHLFRQNEQTDLGQKEIFISTGSQDRISLPGESVQLKKWFQENSANVSFYMSDYGHELTEPEIKEAMKWWKVKNTRDEKETE